MPLFSSFEPRWNVSPTAILGAVFAPNFNPDAALQQTHLRWGIKAPWATPDKSVRPLINARSETLFSKPTFRDLAKTHRAIVPVTGFYEWERLENQRIPYYVQVRELPAMLLATVFQPLTDAEIEAENKAKASVKTKKTSASPQMGFAFDEPAESSEPAEPSSETATENALNLTPNFTGDFAVVTTQATGELAAIHHRAPVMLNIEQAIRWLYTEDLAELEALMRPEAIMPVRMSAVGDAVNSSRNDGPECVEAV